MSDCSFISDDRRHACHYSLCCILEASTEAQDQIWVVFADGYDDAV